MNSTRSFRDDTRALRDDAGGYADDARGLAAQALESTRDYANQALSRASDKMRDLRWGMKDMANRGASSMSEYTRATGRYVSEQPLKSALIAAAVGAAVAGLILAMRRNRNDY
ncbi:MULTISPECIES: DUF883 family protein [Ramlibacter]|uniref:DUF883 family protein n=1 Tax=Ramlibacter aquaticus TaxID=2780094 RepID=A0ABR9SGB1_9BURK|nr:MULTISPECIES: DUF883 family protein [Ramlibacter]MBE7941381.1 DUF883 family protein [Ramlibacter aquaticus]